MRCTNVPSQLEAYADDELDSAHDAREIADITQHLAGCADCRAEVANIKRLSASLRQHLPHYPANDMLRARVQTLVANFGTEMVPAFVPSISGTSIVAYPQTRSLRNWKILALAASALFALVTAHDVTSSIASRDTRGSVNRELINAHIRSLMSDHLVDVPSSDRHTVKPWFEGKINFSPAVFDFAADSFPLSGGRLDYANGHAMAAVIFHHGQHAINLFIWPVDSSNANVASTSQDGYNISTWRRNHLRYAAVSTLNSRALAQFAAMYVARDSTTGADQH